MIRLERRDYFAAQNQLEVLKKSKVGKDIRYKISRRLN